MANPEHVAKLKDGVEAWNEWRMENVGFRPDLERADLRRAKLWNTNLEGANLWGADLWRANLWGANLWGANLGQANFQEANLQSANLGGANLQNANLGQANLRQANLQGANLREVNLEFINLQEVNLQYANLKGANFKGANLWGADLVEANLQNTNLLASQALFTDFSNTNLTGACIAQWGINEQTNFTNVQCDFIYLGWDEEKECPTDRRPHNLGETFAPGDFVRFMEQARNTVDLIFNDGIDWSAFATSLGKLNAERFTVQSEDQALSVKAIELKDDGSFVVRLKSPIGADKAAIEQDFRTRYGSELKRLEADYQSRLQLKDEQIAFYKERNTDMTDIVKMLANRPINVEATAMSDSVKQQFTGPTYGVTGTVKGDQIINVQSANEQAESSKAPSPRTILLLAANPSGTQQLRLDEEVRQIEQALERSKHRDSFQLVQKWAVTADDLRRALLDNEPDIVHFSGHGAGEQGLVFEGGDGKAQRVSGDALSRLFEMFNNEVKCVVLNACLSSVQARAIGMHIDYVVGMDQEIGDVAAQNFSTGFYDALGAGRNVEQAYKFGCNAIELQNIPEYLTPQLIGKAVV